MLKNRKMKWKFTFIQKKGPHTLNGEQKFPLMSQKPAKYRHQVSEQDCRHVLQSKLPRASSRGSRAEAGVLPQAVSALGQWESSLIPLHWMTYGHLNMLRLKIGQKFRIPYKYIHNIFICRNVTQKPRLQTTARLPEPRRKHCSRAGQPYHTCAAQGYTSLCDHGWRNTVTASFRWDWEPTEASKIHLNAFKDGRGVYLSEVFF